MWRWVGVCSRNVKQASQSIVCLGASVQSLRSILKSSMTSQRLRNITSRLIPPLLPDWDLARPCLLEGTEKMPCKFGLMNFYNNLWYLQQQPSGFHPRARESWSLCLGSPRGVLVPERLGAARFWASGLSLPEQPTISRSERALQQSSLDDPSMGYLGSPFLQTSEGRQ